jgi:hypothetical protein
MLRRAMMAGGGGGATDPYWANVVALLHFDGANGSTTFTDETGKTWTATGTAALATASKKFGTASLNNGTGVAVAGPYADFGFGTGDFTIEGWKRLTSAGPGFACIFDNRSGANQGIAIYDKNAAGGSFITVFNNAAQMGATTFGVPDTTNFYHWSVCRQGTTLYASINGSVEAIATDSRTYAASPSATIGANYLGSQPQVGFMDEFRMTKGVARYTANFTPPTAAFPNS